MTIEQKIDADLEEMTKEIHPKNRGCLFLIIMIVLSAFFIYFTTLNN